MQEADGCCKFLGASKLFLILSLFDNLQHNCLYFYNITTVYVAKFVDLLVGTPTQLVGLEAFSRRECLGNGGQSIS